MLQIPRFQLIELHEQPWVPASIRRVFRDNLAWTQQTSRVYHRFLPKLQRWMAAAGSSGCLDLCSGTGDLSVSIQQQLRRRGVPMQVRLSDLFPEAATYAALARRFGDGITYAAEPTAESL